MARHARSLRELVAAIRPLDGDRDRAAGRAPAGDRLAVPIAAYLSALYGDGTAPVLTVEVADDSGIDWVAETVLLQIVQEALHNVWRHSRATTVAVRVGLPDAGGVVVAVCDDGVGFDATPPEGTGIAAMRSSAGVVGGSIIVMSRPGRGTSVVAWLGPAPADGPPGDPAPPGRPRLHLVAGSSGLSGR